MMGERFPYGLVLLGTTIAAALVIALTTALPARDYGETRQSEVFRDCGECPEMLPLSPGDYLMGMEDGRRAYVMAALGLAPSARKRVTISYNFAVSRHEITFAQWDACVAAGGCDGYTPSDEGWGRGDRPVIHVSWQDAQAYVRWLSEQTGFRYRLLSEAEWEYAARGGAQSAYAWGGGASHRWANYGEPDCPPCTGSVQGADAWLNTAPVGQFPPNQFGLFDMHGNVYEWVEDCFSDPLPREPVDGAAYEAAACENHVMRGGAWYSDPGRIRAAYRAYNTPNSRGAVIGFRVARDL
jgi:formylglycine-generating enzyme required for sulfatase activity